MSLHLPVSSFPDAVSHDHRSLDLNVRIVVTPPPSKRLRPRLDYVFGRYIFKPTTSSTIPTPVSDEAGTLADVLSESVYSELREASSVIAQTHRSPSPDEIEHHIAHHRSMSGPFLSHRTSWIDVLPNHRAPRSTKESIATLGLSRRTPSPDSSSDAESMVACCCNSGWVDPQPLPPLPPLPPPSPPLEPLHLKLSSHNQSSSMKGDLKEGFGIIPEGEDGDDPLTQQLETSSQTSSVPPSPITFSHRNSVFLSMGSPQGIETVNEASVTTASLTADSSLPRGAASPSPSSLRHKRNDASSVSPEFAAHVAARPYTRVSHLSASALFAPAPKLLKFGAIPKPPPSPSKRSLGLYDWRIFRRRQRSAADENGPEAQAGQPAEEPDCISGTPRPFTGRKHHRNSIHFGSFSSLNTESLCPRRSSVGSEQTLSSARDADSPVRGLHHHKSMSTLRSVTTHRVAGDTWREEEIESVIDTLRTMKVAKLR